MKSKDRADRIALFVDLDNFVGYCLGLGLQIDLAPELNRLTEMGKVTVRRSFGDIFKLPMSHDRKAEVRKMLQNNLVQHEDIPYQNAYKNSADIRLVIDALSLAYSNEDIDMVAVVASDRDYLPLFAKLREMGKEIIGIGGSRDNTPDIYVKACDYFFYHEVLTGRAPSPLKGEGVPEGLSELTPADSVASDVPGGAACDQIERQASTEMPHEEAVRLLTDALQALEARGSTVHSGASVSQMMRRLRADFDISAYGYGSFKELCEEAARAGLISIEHSGVVFNLRMNSGMDADKGVAAGVPDAEESRELSTLHLRNWLECKMRARLPTLEERLKIYVHLRGVMDEVDEVEGVNLVTLTDLLLKRIGGKDLSQATCYKVLYSLYRANCFICTQGTSPFNPVIHLLREAGIDQEKLDARFIENNLRVYARESGAAIVPDAWSEVFFGSPAQAEMIREVSRSL